SVVFASVTLTEPVLATALYHALSFLGNICESVVRAMSAPMVIRFVNHDVGAWRNCADGVDLSVLSSVTMELMPRTLRLLLNQPPPSAPLGNVVTVSGEPRSPPSKYP